MSFFQLKDTAECRNLMFLSFDHLSRLGVPVGGSHYNKVYSGTLKSGENLDSIYERFNLYHPDDFRGHSLSVSDVIRTIVIRPTIMWTHLGSGRCLNFLGFEGGAYRRQCRMITIDIVRLEEYDEANKVYLLFDEVKKHD